MDSYQLTLVTHIASGTAALASFWTAAALRKGSPAHRRAGQAYLLAMLAVLVSGGFLAYALLARGHAISALFLAFLLQLTGHACWNAWRAIRDRGDRSRYFGFTYWLLAAVTGVFGAGVVAVGLETGQPLLQIFGGVGVFVGIGSVRAWRRAQNDPKWWLREHWQAMLGNGVATHIAFFSIGLRKLLPMVDPQVLTLIAWCLPLLAATAATVWLNRRYGRRPVQGRAVTA